MVWLIWYSGLCVHAVETQPSGATFPGRLKWVACQPSMPILITQHSRRWTDGLGRAVGATVIDWKMIDDCSWPLVSSFNCCVSGSSHLVKCFKRTTPYRECYWDTGRGYWGDDVSNRCQSASLSVSPRRHDSWVGALGQQREPLWVSQGTGTEPRHMRKNNDTQDWVTGWFILQ